MGHHNELESIESRLIGALLDHLRRVEEHYKRNHWWEFWKYPVGEIIKYPYDDFCICALEHVDGCKNCSDSGPPCA